MPKTNYCRPRVDPREAELKALVEGGMARRSLNQKTLAQKAKMAASTLCIHIQEPRKMTLGELWDIIDVLKPYEDEFMRLM